MEDKADKKLKLLELIKKDAVFRGDYTLSSGKKSSYYIDLRLVTLSSEGAYLIGEVISDVLAKEKVDAIGGLTMGADPIAGAVAAISYKKGKPINAFIVRKEVKEHGKGKAIEGPLKKASRVAVIDDVATSGGSLIKAIESLEKEGHKIVKVMCLVDRGEGAPEILSSKGYTLFSLYTKKDLGL